ncbi:MAG: Trk family potassium uptake protein [Planctomycetota bacterium]|nr:MAG: Trk family potassium uptake protein [Planctomycetota bacterium]
MELYYKNRHIERWVGGFNFVAAAAVIAIFVMLYGFDRVVLPLVVLHAAEVVLCFYFFAEKIIRFFNAESKRRFLRFNWFEIPLLLVLLLIAGGADRWFPLLDRDMVLLPAVSVYLVLQVLSKVCLGMVRFASTGKNPTMGLIILFIILICAGAGLLMLPKAHNLETMSITDAFFTATSATCVTGLIVADTGRDFTLMGQTIILILIQLGGLGIVVFGAVLALLLGQALSVKESLAMQDLLNARTLRSISMMIGFIFLGTIVIEAIGAVSLMPMWDNVPSAMPHPDMKWFYSVFHSISAFCNAGFSLFNTSLIDYNTSFGVYTVIAPLVILGGLGFGVLYNLTHVGADAVKRFFRRRFDPASALTIGPPQRIRLQTKIVLTTSLILIAAGTILLMLFESYSPEAEHDSGFKTALFQSITARTAGFNTVNVAVLSEASKMILMVLMFIGGSPGSTAGGIKTVTLAVVIMVIYATLRKRREVELFKRSVRLAVVGRAITVMLLFAGLLILMTMLLVLTESDRGWSLLDLAFEATSALGTVGLSTGVTPTLTTAGKWIIIATMLIGRLGPLTLLVGLTFNLKPASYDYPSEPLMVG